MPITDRVAPGFPLVALSDASIVTCEEIGSRAMIEGLQVVLSCYRVTQTGSAIETMVRQRFPGVWSFAGSTGRPVSMVQPISDHSLLLWSSNGKQWATVERPIGGPSGTDSVLVRRFGVSQPSPIVTAISYRGKAATEADAAKYLELARLAGAASIAEARRNLRLPRFLPGVPSKGGVVIARDGKIWMQVHTFTGVRYYVINEHGRITHVLEGPAEFEMFDADGASVWGVERDETDVPRIVKYSMKVRS
jgi:hypothetical protein